MQKLFVPLLIVKVGKPGQATPYTESQVHCMASAAVLQHLLQEGREKQVTLLLASCKG